MTKTIGFIGSGDVAERKTRALLNDQLDAHETLRFILPVTKEHFTDRISTIAQWAMKEEVPVEVVTSESTADLLKSRTLDKETAKELLDVAVKEHKVSRIPHKIVSLLGEAKKAELFVLWDDEDDDCYKALERAGDAEVRAFDFTNGLEELELDGEEAAESGEAPDEEEETPEPEDEDLGAVKGFPGPVPSKDELEKMDLEEVQEVAGKLGIEFPKRTRKNTYIAAILEKAGGEEQDEEPADEEEPETPADEDVEIPEEEPAHVPTHEEYDASVVDASVVEVIEGEVVSATAHRIPHVISECKGCGGPVLYEDDEVVFYHADACPMAG